MLNKTHDLTFDQLGSLVQNRIGHQDSTCPFCSPYRKRENRDKKVARVWYAGNFANLFCVHCEAKAWVPADDGHVIAPERLEGGFDTERHLRAEGKTWPETPVQRTRPGGRHLILQHQHHLATVTGSNRLGLRTAGGRLTWRLGRPAPVPQWPLDHLATEATRRNVEDQVQTRIKPTVELEPQYERARKALC